MKVLAFASSDDLLLEVLNFSVQAGLDVDILITGDNCDGRSRELAKRGAKSILICDAVDPTDEDSLTSLISELSEKYDMILTSSDRIGKAVSARVSQKMGAGSVMDVTSFRKEGDELILVRHLMGGKAVAEERVIPPAVVGIKPRKFEPAEENPVEPEIKRIEFSPVSRIRIVERREKKVSGVRLDRAEIVIGCGRGFKSKDDLKLAYELAELLGAAVGSSRPLAADLKWMPEERWIGMSGVTIKPKLYIAVGISGQQQHIAGITDSKIIVAVNSDPNAPIFKSADYGVVQDLYKFLPALKSVIGRRRK